MELKSTMKVKSNVRVELVSAETGETVRVIEGENMVVNTGLNFMRDAISRATTPMSYIADGSGSTAAAAGDTTLEAELGRVAVIGYDDQSTGVIRFRASFEANQGNGNVREFGLLNASTLGTLFAHYVLGASFTKDTSLLMRVYWTLTFTDV